MSSRWSGTRARGSSPASRTAFAAVRYHSLAAVELPACLRRTAYDETSGLPMGVAHRDLPLVGVQFHPESVLSEHGALLVANFLGLS